MITIEALDKLVNEHQFSYADLARLLKTTRSQIGMVMRGLRDLPPHSELLLFEFRENLVKIAPTDKAIGVVYPQIEGKEEVQSLWQQRLNDIDSIKWKLEKELQKMKRVKNRSSLVADVYHKIIKVLPDGDDLHGHFKWKLRNKKKLIIQNGLLRQLDLQMKKDLLSAEANIITKYLAILD